MHAKGEGHMGIDANLLNGPKGEWGGGQTHGTTRAISGNIIHASPYFLFSSGA